MTFADKGYQGARGSVRTPYKQRRFRPKLSRRQKAVNRAHAKIRARGEWAIATLKDLESPDQAALLPTPRNRDRAGHPRPAPRRSQPLRRMKKAVNTVARRTEDQSSLGPAQIGQRRGSSRREGTAFGEVDLRRKRFDQSVQYSFPHVVVDHAASVWRPLPLHHRGPTGGCGGRWYR
jgi:hypothetical protein